MTQGLSFQMPAAISERQHIEAAIAHLLTQAQCDPQLTSELAQSVELAPFHLGDVIYDSARSENAALLLIVQGRVRLRCCHPAKPEREFSVQVLESGAIVASPSLLREEEAESYRAIAASEGLLARIAPEILDRWLQQLPSLEHWLQASSQERNELIFLRAYAFGQERSLASYQLQLLKELLVSVNLKAGQSLVQHPALAEGFNWLRQGVIQSQSSQKTAETNSLPPPQVGEGWGYPEATPKYWKAKTDIQLYSLPQKDWAEAVSLGLSTFSFATAPSNTDQATQSSPGQPQVRNPFNRNRSSRRSELTDSQEIRSNNAGSDRTNENSEHDSAQSNHRQAPDVSFPIPPRRLRLRFWNRYPFINQQSAADCGPTCLAMIALFWGQRLNVNVLRELAHVGRGGSTLKNLAGAAEKAGFVARPVRASFNRLADQNMPWVAHWQGDHYVVVYKTGGDRILLSDPARGKRQLSKQNFLRNWTGYALLLEPTDRLKQSEAVQKASLKRFWKVLWPYRNILWQIIALSLLLQAFGLVSPILTQVILDQVVVQKSLATLNVFVIGAFLFGSWGIVLGAVRQYLLDYFSNRLNLTLVSGFVNHTLQLPIAFFENRQVGDIITRVRENQKIQVFLMRQAFSTWLDASTALVYLVLMFNYNAQLAWLVVGMLPPIIILTLCATPFLKQLSREVFNKSAEQNSLLVEMLTGISTVKASAAEQEIRWRWEERLTERLNIQFRTQKLTNALGVVSGLINSTGSLLLLWYGARLVISDQLTIGQLIAFNMLIGNVIGPVLALVGLWDEFQEVLIAVERLNDVLENQPESDTGKPMLMMPPIQGEVRFENVSFRYDEGDDQNVLQNISFRAQPGETIALVGRSGSGKTTLVKLLQGMYTPSNGRISIDGHDISHVSPSSLRSQMGVVPQESFLFSGNILENIKIYREDYELDEVVEVAKLAEAHTFIQDLPMGYSTKVGERGANLSGGQRQRVAIARALLGNPAILLLDEATSALDTESERRFQHNLTHISQGRTTFIIAHRLSTVRNADRILVLERGVITEQGNHEALVQQKGLYYHLAQQQLEL